jgi:hypothetical protein
MQDNAAGPDSAVLADRHARTNDDARRDPDVRADDDGQGVLEVGSRSPGSTGWVAAQSCTPGPSMVRAPIVTEAQSRMTQ